MFDRHLNPRVIDPQVVFGQTQPIGISPFRLSEREGVAPNVMEAGGLQHPSDPNPRLVSIPGADRAL